MILKSKIIENNLSTLKDYNPIIFYGENEGLKNENKELKAQIKEWEIERDEVLRECVKLSKLVEELRDAIEEPKELDDK